MLKNKQQQNTRCRFLTLHVWQQQRRLPTLFSGRYALYELCSILRLSPAGVRVSTDMYIKCIYGYTRVWSLWLCTDTHAVETMLSLIFAYIQVTAKISVTIYLKTPPSVKPVCCVTSWFGCSTSLNVWTSTSAQWLPAVSNHHQLESEHPPAAHGFHHPGHRVFQFHDEE